MPTASTTGRYLVLLRDGATSAVSQLADLAQVRVVHARGPGPRTSGLPEHCALVFDHIGVALLRCEPPRQQRLMQAAQARDSAILVVEPERRVRALARRADTQGSTWGVEAVGAPRSPYTGKGIRLAVLDTGVDLAHPDFSGRQIVTRSFIDGESIHDENGHGTHCAGVAGGPTVPESQPRYGVAGGVELYVGKVLSNAGTGADGSVLAGIDWAIQNGCQLISMSLGTPSAEGEPYSAVFEAVAQRAMAAGTLILAAAGNESDRPRYIAPVGHPANCPSIVAVAAVDSALAIAPFSCGGSGAAGGEVNLSGPGVDILSAWPLPQGYHRISGTSMATPFVAGVAALHAEADPHARGARLAETLIRNAKPLSLPERDVGAGLVQAPFPRGSS